MGKSKRHPFSSIKDSPPFFKYSEEARKMELYHWDLFSPDIDEYLRAEIAKKLESIEVLLNDIYF